MESGIQRWRAEVNGAVLRDPDGNSNWLHISRLWVDSFGHWQLQRYWPEDGRTSAFEWLFIKARFWWRRTWGHLYWRPLLKAQLSSTVGKAQGDLRVGNLRGAWGRNPVFCMKGIARWLGLCLCVRTTVQVHWVLWKFPENVCYEKGMHDF